MAQDKIPPDRRVVLEDDGTGVLVASYTWKLYRFLLSDGRTVDIKAIRDDSDLRATILEVTKVEKIEGMARVPDPTPVAKKAPAKRVGTRRA